MQKIINEGQTFHRREVRDGEALRDDDEFAYVAAWEWGGDGGAPVLHKEDLVYEHIELKQRSYK